MLDATLTRALNGVFKDAVAKRPKDQDVPTFIHAQSTSLCVLAAFTSEPYSGPTQRTFMLKRLRQNSRAVHLPVDQGSSYMTEDEALRVHTLGVWNMVA